jgi:hypothetical protein
MIWYGHRVASGFQGREPPDERWLVRLQVLLGTGLKVYYRGLFFMKFHRSSERAETQGIQSCFRDEQIAKHIMHMFVVQLRMWSTEIS